MSLDAGLDDYGLNKKRTLLLLRSVVVASLSYLILFAQAGTSAHSGAYILALIVSNLALAVIPGAVFNQTHFSKILFLFDTAGVLIGLYFTVGFSQDFLIVYFFTMFLTAAVDTVGQIAVGAIFVSGLYGIWLWMTAGTALGSGEWLRLPFFFIVAVFYAYMTEEVKRERVRRLQAERESEHLRFLLMLGDAFAQQGTAHDWTERVKGVIETAFPRLTAAVQMSPPTDGSGGIWVPFVTRGKAFGGIVVAAKDGTALSPDEEQFCSVAAFVAANGLYTAEQTRAIGDGVRLKDEFLSNLSHEFRTPLHGMLGYLDLLEDGLQVEKADDTVMESLVRLRANTHRLQNLLEELLWFAELRAGHRPKVLEPVDLRELFAQFEGVISQQLAGRAIRFVWEILPDVPVVHTDERKLRQIVSGLLSNAVKFTERGQIHLRARCVPGGQIEVSVEDSGIGIDPQHFNLIFEEFRQLDGSLTRRVDGLGLGLALARELTALLNGRITVESGPGQGSTFRVRLPIGGGASRDLKAAFLPKLRLANSLAS